MEPYAVDRLRQHLRILEPDEQVDPYRQWGGIQSDLQRALIQLGSIHDCAELGRRIRQLQRVLPREGAGRQLRHLVLQTALDLAFRLDQAAADALIGDVVQDALAGLDRFGAYELRLLNRAFQLAGRTGSVRYLPDLLALLNRALNVGSGDPVGAIIIRLIASVIDALERLERWQEMAAFMERATQWVEDQLPAVPHGSQYQVRAAALLVLSRGWLLLDQAERAEPALRWAISLITAASSDLRMQLDVGCAYAGALSALPAPQALERLSVLLADIGSLNDTLATSNLFRLGVLRLADAIVLSFAGDSRLRRSSPISLTPAQQPAEGKDIPESSASPAERTTSPTGQTVVAENAAHSSGCYYGSQLLLSAVASGLSGRKLRLFACHCCRQIFS
jgi:hypothetical protein